LGIEAAAGGIDAGGAAAVLPGHGMRQEPDLNFVTRKGVAGDLGLLREMLFEAAYWRPGVPRPGLEAGLARPDLASLLSGWGRTGDLALVAVTPDGVDLGAAWLRYWTEELHSYGFVDAATPELGIGVRAEARRHGVGEALLRALLTEARQLGVRRISLSVEKDNPAIRLYRRVGFVDHAEAGSAWTMVADLGEAITATRFSVGE
jgi:GNAT superfamily N-acetyltransferase